jgi:hypothetical protein
MRGTLTTAALVIAATLVAAVSASAEILPGTIPTRDEYVATVDPICQKNSDTNKPLLKTAGKKERNDELASASRDVARVAANFGKTLTKIEAVPRPTEDSPRLEKWFGYLKTLQTNLGKISKALKEEDKVKASHAKIKVERTSNAANNVSFVFQFQYCHLKASQFK